MRYILAIIFTVLFLATDVSAQSFQGCGCFSLDDCDNDGILAANECPGADNDPLSVDQTPRFNGVDYEKCVDGAWQVIPASQVVRVDCSQPVNGNGSITNPFSNTSCIDDQFASCAFGAKPTAGDHVFIGGGCPFELDYSGSAPTGLSGTPGNPITFYGDPQNTGVDSVEGLSFNSVFSDFIRIQNMEISGGTGNGIFTGIGGDMMGLEIIANEISNFDFGPYDGSNKGHINLSGSNVGTVIRNNRLTNYTCTDAGCPANANLANIMVFQNKDLYIGYNELSNPALLADPTVTGAPLIKIKHARDNGTCASLGSGEPTCTQGDGSLTLEHNYLHTADGGFFSGEQNTVVQNNYFLNTGKAIQFKDQGGWTWLEDNLVRSNTIVGGDCLEIEYQDVWFDNGVKRYGPIDFDQNVCIPNKTYSPGSNNAINIDRFGTDAFEPLVNAAHPPSGFSDNCYWADTGNLLFGYFQATSFGSVGGSCSATDWQAGASCNVNQQFDQGSDIQDPNLDACGCTTVSGAIGGGDCANIQQAGYCIRSDQKTVQISLTDSDAGEPNNNGEITITLIGGEAPPGGLLVYLNYGGSATNEADPAADYDYIVGTGASSLGTLANPIVIPAGDESISIPITIFNDTIIESGGEFATFSVAGTNDPNCVIASVNLQLDIADNDPEDTTTTTTTLPTNTGGGSSGQGYLYRLGCFFNFEEC